MTENDNVCIMRYQKQRNSQNSESTHYNPIHRSQIKEISWKNPKNGILGPKVYSID
jgi:hypothetical protein